MSYEVKFYSRPSYDSGGPQRDADLNTAVFSLIFPCDAAINEAELGKLWLTMSICGF